MFELMVGSQPHTQKSLALKERGSWGAQRLRTRTHRAIGICMDGGFTERTHPTRDCDLFRWWVQPLSLRSPSKNEGHEGRKDREIEPTLRGIV